MYQYRHLIDLLRTVVALYDERRQESMAQGLRCLGVAQDVPIEYDQSRFLGKVCKMAMVKIEEVCVCVCTDEHVPLVLCTPAILGLRSSDRG